MTACLAFECGVTGSCVQRCTTILMKCFPKCCLGELHGSYARYMFHFQKPKQLPF